MSKKKNISFKGLKKVLPYFTAAFLTIGLASVGSLDKKGSTISLSLDNFAKQDYKITVDQMSALYVVADISNTMGLASAADVAANYVATTSMYDAGQTSTGKLEKPPITNIAVSRGVVEYIVAEGESMDSIAAKYNISTDDIRWSNGLKTTDISAGDLLYVPSVSGIVYTVQSGDTLESIAEKYGSSVKEITVLNDLEVTNISEGMRILIKGGTLPETERPEYVPPVKTYTYTYTYTYLGDSSQRQDVNIIATGFYDANYPYPNPNPGVPGWCTWYAWYWRATSPSSLGELGHEGRNANTWHINYAYRGVGNTPVVGAVFQTPYGGGGYGHVGVVVGINGDGSIVVREMNYAGRYVVTESIIPAAYVGNFNYIY